MNLQTAVNVLGWSVLTYACVETNKIFFASCHDSLKQNIRYHREAKHNQALVEHYREKARLKQQELNEKRQAFIKSFRENVRRNQELKEKDWEEILAQV